MAFKLVNFKSKTAFTLVELLVVVAIIGLLVSLVVFSINTVRARARDATRVADIKSLQDALAFYHNDVQRYPICFPDGCYLIDGTDDCSQILVSQGVIRTVPVDPANVSPYQYYYESDGAGSTYRLEYYLETDSVYGKSSGENWAVP